MPAPNEDGNGRFGKIVTIVATLLFAVPLALGGIGFVVSGLFEDPASVTVDGVPVRYSLFLMGAALLLGSALTIGLMVMVWVFFRLLVSQLQKHDRN